MSWLQQIAGQPKMVNGGVIDQSRLPPWAQGDPNWAPPARQAPQGGGGFFSTIGEYIAPQIRQPTLSDGTPVGPAPSKIDRWIPLLSGLGAAAANSQDVPGIFGNLLGGFAQGRQSQQYLAQQMYAPYYRAIADERLGAEQRARMAQELDRLASGMTPEQANRVRMQATLGQMMKRPPSANEIFGELPKPAKVFNELEQEESKARTEMNKAEAAKDKELAKRGGSASTASEDRQLSREQRNREAFIDDVDTIYKQESLYGAIPYEIVMAKPDVRRRILGRALVRKLDKETVDQVLANHTAPGITGADVPSWADAPAAQNKSGNSFQEVVGPPPTAAPTPVPTPAANPNVFLPAGGGVSRSAPQEWYRQQLSRPAPIITPTPLRR